MQVSRDQILSRRTAAWLILIGGAAFCAFLTLSVVIDPTDRDITGSSSYSRSAVGHAALVALLREKGFRVRINRDRSAASVAAEDVLLILEPDTRLSSKDDLVRLVEGKRRVLLALPKWRPRPSGFSVRRGWVDGTVPVPSEAADTVARAVIDSADVARTDTAESWTEKLGKGTPTITRPQLLNGTHLEALVATADGILVGEAPLHGRSDTKVIVLADPDLLANHGLHRGDNAAMMLALVNRLLPAASTSTIHVDETLHGLAIVPSLPRLLFMPPFLAATLLALAAVAMTVWRAAARFGAPTSAIDRTPALGTGHETLLRNAGRLLAAGDHTAYIAERYGAASLDEAARRLHVSGHKETDLRGILRAIAGRRGVRVQLPGEGTGRPLAKARRYYDWMQEMFGGSRAHRETR